MSSMTARQALAVAVHQHRSGRIAQAKETCRQILLSEPANADALHFLGLLEYQSGHLAEAVGFLTRAVEANPVAIHFQSNLGAVLTAQGRFKEAADVCRKAIARDPNSVPAMINLGNALCESGDASGALAAYQQALKLKPNSAEVHASLGNALQVLYRFEEAVEAYRRAAEINPQSAAILNNLAGALSELGLVDEAITGYRRAIVLNPNDAGAHRGYAMNLLARGDFAQGWEEFEWRLRLPSLRLNRGFPQPQWDGSDLAGKTILLHVEGGFGDGLQFVRYVPMVAQPSARVILECQRELVSLFQQVPGIDQIVARGDALPAFDCQIPLLGLPRVFHTDLQNIPGTRPYLAAPADRAAFWKNRLKDDAGFKIGLVWAGSYDPRDRRSRTPQVFAPLGQIPGVNFYSLQKGPAGQDPISARLAIKDHTAEIHDFADMAGLVAPLDLVISVDTSTAHLAGAIGKPVWVMIPFISEFRWLRERSDSPWYPSMRLFRQSARGSWEPVISRIKDCLQERLRSG